MLDISKLSQSERNKLADGLSAAAESMSIEDKRLLIEALSSALDKNVKEQATTGRAKVFAEKLAAMKADKHVGASNAVNLIEGNLKRYNCPPLADLGVKPLHEINDLMAAAKVPTNDRMAIKSMLHRLGAID